MRAYRPAHGREYCENEKRERSLGQHLPKNLGVAGIESQCFAHLRPLAHIDKVVGAAQQVIEICRQLAAGGVFPYYCQVRSGLSIEQPQFL